ncbi:MAG TPA: carboxypeptidase-like regulatory domain-containing protein [Telluria sp.]|nr:carboxypeptidase-like regulatory domain-containing protein [Telluria sp.]
MYKKTRILTALFVLCFKSAAFAGDLKGTVEDAHGRPVAHATVAATAALPERLPDGQIVRHLTHTDSEGHFHLPGLPGGTYGATATFPDLGSAFIGNLVLPNTGVLAAPALRLGGAATNVRGTLLVSSGALPQGLIVGAARISTDTGDVFYGDIQDRRYVLSLAPGHYILAAKAPGWESATTDFTIPGPLAQFDLALHREQGMEPKISQELVAMEAADQEVRARWAQSPLKGAFDQEMAKIDGANESRIVEIIRDKGWPDAEMVGVKAANAMWVLVQHASPLLLKKCLPYMKEAAAKNELSWATVALSIDRDLVYDGKKQIYGSQFRSGKDGNMEMYPVEDEQHLDDRRQRVGLQPIATYRATLLNLRTPPAAGK